MTARCRELGIGTLRAVLINDGELTAAPHVLFTNAGDADLGAALAGRVDLDGCVRAPRNVLLLRGAETVILVDTGFGAFAAALGLPASELPDALAACDVRPEDVDHVVLTHAHGDHTGGLTDGDDLAFPRALHHVHAAELDFWLSDASDGQPEPLKLAARTQLGALTRSDRLAVLRRGVELADGIRAEPAPGHTPGHLIVTITSGDGAAVFVADAVLDPLHVERPDYVAAMDVSPVQTVRTREALLARAADERTLVIASHIAWPWHVERRPGGFRAVPVAE